MLLSQGPGVRRPAGRICDSQMVFMEVITSIDYRKMPQRAIAVLLSAVNSQFQGGGGRRERGGRRKGGGGEERGKEGRGEAETAEEGGARRTGKERGRGAGEGGGEGGGGGGGEGGGGGKGRLLAAILFLFLSVPACCHKLP